MTISTLEAPKAERFACPRCGHPVASVPRYAWVETALGVLASVALVLILVPLGIMAWKACTGLLSDGESHSILYHPLEDWTPY
jgi:hypothetical protein